MRVIAKGNRGYDLSRRALELSGNAEEAKFPLTIGMEYTVYAMAAWMSGIGVMILSDRGRVHWSPMDLFDVRDGRLPVDWRFGVAVGGGDVLALWGYESLITEPLHHDQLVNGDVLAVEKFLAERDKSHETAQDTAKAQALERWVEGRLRE